MDHDGTREQLELAALEPGGFDRLIAGDTPSAQAVSAHLAGCPSCTDELARLERAARLIRRVVREIPPAGLRELTLDVVRAAGVARKPPMPAAAPAPPSTAARRSAGGSRGRPSIGWVAAIAAAVVISVGATSVVVGSRVDAQLAAQAEAIEALEHVTTATLKVTGEPDVRRVALSGSDPTLAGSLIYSPSTSELVVVATGLTPAPSGQEYSCWVEQAGQRQRVGKMFFGDGLAYWIGPAPAVKGVQSGATFGVSLVDASGSALGSQEVLGGGL